MTYSAPVAPAAAAATPVANPEAAQAGSAAIVQPGDAAQAESLAVVQPAGARTASAVANSNVENANAGPTLQGAGQSFTSGIQQIGSSAAQVVGAGAAVRMAENDKLPKEY